MDTKDNRPQVAAKAGGAESGAGVGGSEGGRQSAAPDAAAPAELRRRLMPWYERNGRHDLPWRLTRDPYAVLVSEVMLQQTQASRVLPHFTRWITRWPTVQSLAAASAGDVIRAWAGLGYNRRALNLHRAAGVVVERFGGELPVDAPRLQELPGIGPYTAGAVACFAAGAREPFADTNIGRVLARARLGLSGTKDAGPARIRDAATELLPCEGAREHNLALMDLGATVCTARTPACLRCPLTALCAWRAAGSPAAQRSHPHPALRFEHTSRFARGRIMDALRSSPRLRLVDIAATLPPVHAGRAAEHLERLNEEGLVQRDGEWWQLPA